MKNGENKLYKLIIIGHLMINLPVIIICLGLPVLSILFIEGLLFKIIATLLLFFGGLSISWKYWSYLITKWRIWAFKQIDENDWVKLKELAIENKLIWEDGSGYEKTEIRTEVEDIKITLIAEKIFELEQIEEIKLNLKTPRKIGYRLSKLQNLAESISLVFIITISIIILFTKAYILGIIILLLTVLDLRKLNYLKKLFIPKDYLELSIDGIRIGFLDEDLIKWDKIDAIEMSRDAKYLTVYIQNKRKIHKKKCEVWRLKSFNHYEFDKYVRLFIDRYNLNERS